MEDYWWTTGSTAGRIKAKDMESACVKAIKQMIPDKLDKLDKKKLFFNGFKVVKGKLPENW